MKNRDPQHRPDTQQLEHLLGKYIISDTPMTEEQWAKERATVLDVEQPRFGDGREENHLSHAKAPQWKDSLVLPKDRSSKPKRLKWQRNTDLFLRCTYQEPGTGPQVLRSMACLGARHCAAGSYEDCADQTHGSAAAIVEGQA
jgi:hypothetical protein